MVLDNTTAIPVSNPCWGWCEWTADKTAASASWGFAKGGQAVAWLSEQIDTMPSIGETVVNVAKRLPRPQDAISVVVIGGGYTGALYCTAMAWENFSWKAKEITQTQAYGENGTKTLKYPQQPSFKKVIAYLALAALALKIAQHEYTTGFATKDTPAAGTASAQNTAQANTTWTPPVNATAYNQTINMFAKPYIHPSVQI